MNEEEERKREIRRWLIILIVFFLIVGIMNLFELRIRVSGAGTYPPAIEVEGSGDAGVEGPDSASSPGITPPPASADSPGSPDFTDSPVTDSPVIDADVDSKKLAAARELFQRAEELAAGKVVPDDPAAIALYRESASAGLADARYRLAVMYQFGGDVLPQNVIVSYALFRLVEADTAFSHRTDAARTVRELKKLMTPEQIQAGEELVKKLAGGGRRFERALDQAPGQ